MKKNFPLFLFVFASIYTFAQTITDTQTTLISKRTADWCPNCGTYGWSFTAKLKEKVVGKDAILWNVHYSGGLATATSKAMAANLGGNGQPIFFVNTDEDLNVNSSNVNAKVDEAVLIIEGLSGLGSLAGMGTNAVLKNKDLKVDTKVKFYDKIDAGEYYVGTYLVKKNLVWTQASVGPNAVHHSVLDKSLDIDFFGQKIAKAPIADNEEFAVSSSLKDLVLHNNKLEDTKIVTVLWNKTSAGKYIFINARETSLVLDNTSETTENNDLALDFNTVIEGNTISVEINGASNPTLIMFDLNGKSIRHNATKKDGNSYILDNIEALTGNYFIQIKDGKTLKTKQVFFMN
jgi:hypothetical protein